MLAKCDDHGYYRAELCPVCNRKGKFLMSDKELDRVGRVITGILRHFPDRFGVTLDEHGFVPVTDLVEDIKSRNRSFSWLKEEHVIALCETDEKGRYQIKDGRIRATYAHTINVDLSDLPTDGIPDKLYYPASEEEAPMLLERGITPMGQTYVHLSGTMEKANEAGMVKNENPIILEIDVKNMTERGIGVYRAGKDVFLTKDVPADCVSGVEGTE
jgi:putative RNA 2'-phosphotransferase